MRAFAPGAFAFEALVQRLELRGHGGVARQVLLRPAQHVARRVGQAGLEHALGLLDRRLALALIVQLHQAALGALAAFVELQCFPVALDGLVDPAGGAGLVGTAQHGLRGQLALGQEVDPVAGIARVHLAGLAQVLQALRDLALVELLQAVGVHRLGGAAGQQQGGGEGDEASRHEAVCG